MKLNRKLEIAEQAIRSISQHDDADLAMRQAALERLQGFIVTELEAAQERVQKKIAEQVVGASLP